MKKLLIALFCLSVASTAFSEISESSLVYILEDYCKSINHKMVMEYYNPIYQKRLKKDEEAAGLTKKDKEDFVSSCITPKCAIEKARKRMPTGSTDIQTLKNYILSEYASSYFGVVNYCK
jgi:hypothetical protein